MAPSVSVPGIPDFMIAKTHRANLPLTAEKNKASVYLTLFRPPLALFTTSRIKSENRCVIVLGPA